MHCHRNCLPGSEADITYSYDLLNRATGAVQGSQTLTFVQDALGRLTSQTGPLGTIGYTYDAAGRRTSMSYPGSVLTVNYDYDTTGNVTKIRENGATSGVGVLAAYAYDDLGQATSVTFGNGSVQSFAYNTGSQLTTLTNDLGGAATTHDLTQTFSYNPAGQIGSVTRSNDAYAWQAHYNVDRNYVADGLNRIMSAGGVGFTYDARGNLTSDGTNAYTYTAENLLKTGPSSATLAYDPLGRLYETVGGGVTTRFQYDGANLIAEHNGSNAVQRRYVHGPGVDNPIVWYEGSTISNTTRRFLMADERGSVVSVTDSVGATITINAYDEYGIPAPGNLGRFGYTGQTWLPEVKMWYYKARIYAPTLGRFLQTDPIGYEDGMNWYAYVGADPVNQTDPMGLILIGPRCPPGDICVFGRRPLGPDPDPLPPLKPDVHIPPGLGTPKTTPPPDGRETPESGGIAPQTSEIKSKLRCFGSALWANKTGLLLDAGGWVLELNPIGKVGKALGGMAIGAAGMVIGAAEKDVAATGFAYAGKQGAVGEGLGVAAAKRLGSIALAGSTIYDIGKTINVYNSCTHGR